MLRNQNDSVQSTEWKRINMRSVAHLLGVEFIHDLYNRYDPRINAVRFRHTLTTWKDGVVNSYAPLSEWEELGRIVGYQYYSLNISIIEATKALYRRKRKHYHHLIRSLGRADLIQLPDKELASVLLNFQSLVLGELYVLNFVQVEHGLNNAIKRVLSELLNDDSSVDEVFVDLIKTEKPTESQREKQRLFKLALRWRALRVVGLYREEKAWADVQTHCSKYSHLYSAYGENPRKMEDFWKEFESYLEGASLPHFKFFPKLLTKDSLKKLRALRNRKLTVLVPLLVRGGIFRDTNKALLGKSLKYRFAILNEISRRGLEIRAHLDYYLLSEIVDLLQEGKVLAVGEVERRRTHGVMLTRQENFSLYTEEANSIVLKEASGNLKGQCASRGECEGKCKIVLSKEDVAKVNDGDIMIAIGTDFDLIEAMYRSAAVITEEGGILSHASVVCRELGKPCCIGVKDATRLLRDGQTVRVDATHGTITVI